MSDSTSNPPGEDGRELDGSKVADVLGGYLAVKRAVKDLGLGKGKPGKGTCICPICGGVIAFNVARQNGHVWARCENNCIKFIE